MTDGFTFEASIVDDILNFERPEPFPDSTKIKVLCKGIRRWKLKDDDGNPFETLHRLNKNGEPYCQVLLQPFGNPGGKDADRPPVQHYMPLPDREKLDELALREAVRKWSDLYEALGIKPIQGNLEEVSSKLNGNQGMIIVGVEESEEYGNKNTVKSFVKAQAPADRQSNKMTGPAEDIV